MRYPYCVYQNLALNYINDKNALYNADLGPDLYLSLDFNMKSALLNVLSIMRPSWELATSDFVTALAARYILRKVILRILVLGRSQSFE